MARLVFITDYTEQFAYRLLKGVINYSKESDRWVVYRMPLAHKRRLGIGRLIKWCKQWKADVVIGQFDEGDDVSLFRKSGIVALAQDYFVKFKDIPNITADYFHTGEMAADHFLTRGFRNFGFFGYKGVCWSDGRLEGFASRIKSAGYGDKLHIYNSQDLDDRWCYNEPTLAKWLKGLPKPIAIMACDDNQGNLLLNACNTYGIGCPDEVAVIGVDNDSVLDNLSSPTLSSIEVDIELGGYNAADMAARMISDPSYKGEDIVLRPISVVTRMSTSVFATKDKEVVKALRFIGLNTERKISVSDILKEVPLSRRLLETRFKQATGETIYKYISRQRIERFAYLLLNSNDTISEISFKMNEDDPKSFCRRFKAIMGCTPSEFRDNELRK